jgi:hypothetical protein
LGIKTDDSGIKVEVHFEEIRNMLEFPGIFLIYSHLNVNEV